MIREIISNAVCHRSYLTPGKIQVALYDDRLEVTSPGMLDREITVEKMKTGLSRIRNRGIASAFFYMKIIEAWGTGIPRIFHEAKEYGLPEPELLDMGSDFRVNLYRKTAGNTAKELNGATGPEIKNDTNDTKNDTNDTKNDTKMEKHKRDVLQIVRGNPFVTQQEISRKLGISIATVKKSNEAAAGERQNKAQRIKPDRGMDYSGRRIREAVFLWEVFPLKPESIFPGIVLFPAFVVFLGELPQTCAAFLLCHARQVAGIGSSLYGSVILKYIDKDKEKSYN